MPVYDFRCKLCNREFDDFFKSRDANLDNVKCSFCGNDKGNIKIPSKSSIVFNGPGWETNEGRSLEHSKPHRDMDVTSVQGMSKIDKPTASDAVLHKR